MSDITRREFLRNAALASASLGTTIGCSTTRLRGNSRGKNKPNFLIYIADDQYMASVGCYGASPSNTPHVDTFAETGLRFTSAFTPSSMCTPNRGCLLTGLYPLRNGAHPNHSGFLPGIKALPDYMKELGYRTALAGKDGIKFPNEFCQWDVKIDKTGRRVPGANERKHERHRKSDFRRIEEFVTCNGEQPFCLVHSASLPHGPYLNELPNGLSGYDASNWYGDQEFGHDLKILERNGLADNTIVIYLNDNEAGIPYSKYNLYDTSVRIPMLIRWPGHTKSGGVTDAMVSTIDLLPAMIDIAGGDPDRLDLDGRSCVEVLEGKTDEHYDQLFFSYTGVIVAEGKNRQEQPYPIRALRTRRYKYIRNLNHTQPHPKASKKKQESMMRPEEELYDLLNDAFEKQNLAASPDWEDVRKELSNKLDVWMSEMGVKGIESELEALRFFKVK